MDSVLRGEVDVSAEQVLLRLFGSLCMANEERLQQFSDGILAAQTPPRLTVDLRSVAFIDSTGIRGLVALRNRAIAAGVDLSIVSGIASDRLLRLLNLDRFFQVEPPDEWPTLRPAAAAPPTPPSIPLAG